MERPKRITRSRQKSARARALDVLVEIETRQAFANLALARHGEGLEPRDRGLLTELVDGTTRMRRTLDHVLDQFLSRPGATLAPAIRNNLRMAAYQILYLDRIPPHAAVHEAVTLARRYGHEGVARLTNAVLRRVVQCRGGVEKVLEGGSSLASGPEGMGEGGPEKAVGHGPRDWRGIAWPDDPVVRLAVQESYPDWLVQRWVAAYGFEEAERLARAQNQPPPFSLRANRLRIGRNELLARFAEAGVEAEPSPVAPEGIRLHDPGAVARLPGYAEGWWYVQGEAAMLVASVVGPQPGQTVADIGAAPGGKTTHLAELMGDRGKVLAIEPHEGRLDLVRQNALRLGLTCIEPLARDARSPLSEPVDAALVDAPCSGLGTLYRKADLRWRTRPDEIAELARLQRELLEAVAPAIKPGGTLVYSTCTIAPEENEAVVVSFLADHPDFRRGDLARALPEAWQAEAADGTLQLLPHRHGTEGFFMARLERKH